MRLKSGKSKIAKKDRANDEVGGINLSCWHQTDAGRSKGKLKTYDKNTKKFYFGLSGVQKEIRFD